MSAYTLRRFSRDFISHASWLYHCFNFLRCDIGTFLLRGDSHSALYLLAAYIKKSWAR